METQLFGVFEADIKAKLVPSGAGSKGRRGIEMATRRGQRQRALSLQGDRAGVNGGRARGGLIGDPFGLGGLRPGQSIVAGDRVPRSRRGATRGNATLVVQYQVRIAACPGVGALPGTLSPTSRGPG